MEFYLGQIDRCLLCFQKGEVQSGSNHRYNHLSVDHVFPQKACKDHRLVLRYVEEDPFNKIKVCRKHHDEIDARKISTYREGGFGSLIDSFIRYPRSKDPYLKELQREQFCGLAIMVRNRLFRLNGKTPPHLQPIYCRAANKLDLIVVRWQDRTMF